MARRFHAIALFAALSCLAPVASGAPGGSEAAPRSACDMPGFQELLRAAAPGAALPARAVWLGGTVLRWPGIPGEGRFRLYHSASGQLVATRGAPVRGADGAVELVVHGGQLPPPVEQRFRFVPQGVELALAPQAPAAASAASGLRELLRGQVLLVREGADGRVLDAAATQLPGALDELYAAAATSPELGASVTRSGTTFRLWAPTARAVSLCLYRDDAARAESVASMRRDGTTGVWDSTHEQGLAGRYYAYLVDVFVPGVGIVRNRVTDPYSLSLGADSQRSYVADLASPQLAPEGWNDAARATPRVAAATDMVIYELHVRDFSMSDATVPAERRGKFLAFTEAESDGVRHLRRLAQAGITDVHLLPVFDFATVPERDCIGATPEGAPDSETQQAAIAAVKARDCYNWGYDPFHFTAPEGSYASDASDGAARILELRRMVQALHGMGLRVGMDVVYNHTSAAGQAANSVLDRIVPGYYQRLNAEGAVETSTCCANTATEHAMMARLMIDSAVTWARDHRIDSFRFDLMGHQPRAAMERLRARVDAAAGREVQLLGEGWNFGEVRDGARFVQASQLSLNGSGIATFSDRARDAVRGGGPGDNDARQVSAQGYVNGLVYAPNALAPRGLGAADLMRAADMVRVGLAGSIRGYALQDHRGARVTLEGIDYNGQPAGYVSEPGEVVNYVENHDNQTLFDLNAFKLPAGTAGADRARVQVLAAAVVAFSQGIAYFHAGLEILRSKSMDRNSYDSGDWFNRIDWSLRDNHFGSGLPPQGDNGSSWALMKPRLADPSIKPTPADIRWTRDAFLDLLRIRASSSLFRLRSAEDIRTRLRLLNTGPGQIPTVLAGRLDGEGYPGAGFREVLYFINVDTRPQTLVLAGERGKPWALHPVHLAKMAADPRPARAARFDAATGAFTVPARTALVYVAASPSDGVR